MQDAKKEKPLNQNQSKDTYPPFIIPPLGYAGLAYAFGFHRANTQNKPVTTDDKNIGLTHK